MCDFDVDEYCELWRETTHRARKVHQCSCCEGAINKGSSYKKIFTIFDGHVSSEKVCILCEEAAEDFQSKHGARLVPSEMHSVIEECVIESVRENDVQNTKYWGQYLKFMNRRKKEQTTSASHASNC